MQNTDIPMGVTLNRRALRRDRPADPATSLTSVRALHPDGTVALVVTDDGREGSATTLVVLDATGTVLDRMPVTVGG
ncbi:MAG: hypothetical protein AB7N91_27635 [Candidatus Tectimicrobiota bacterium]